jgi:hypothetical protein
MTDTTDKLIIQAETQGVQQSTDQLNQLGKSMDGVSVASDSIEKSTTSLDSKFQGLERRFNTSAGQASQFAKVQDAVNKAVAQNPDLQQRANDVLAAAAVRYGAAVSAEKELGDEHDRLSTQGQALLHSFRSVGEQLAMGIPPTQALTGQINHLTYAASGQGGLSGAFSEVTGMLGRFITPMTAIIGVTGGAAAAALYLANSWSEARSQVDQALTGIGARTGATATDIANFTKANATATGLSVSQARDVALEFTKTGEVAVSGLKGVGDAIQGYAVLTGKDATEATKDFVGAIQDGLPGIEKLDARYGALDASTLEYIRTLIDAGDKTTALQVFIDKTTAANKTAENSVSGLTAAWQKFKNTVSNIASGPAPQAPQDQLTQLQGQRNQLATTGQNARGEFLDTSQINGALDALDKQIAAVQEKVNAFDTTHAMAQLNAMSKAAFDNVNATLPQIDAIGKLQEALDNLNAVQNTPGAKAPAYDDGAIAVLEHQKSLQQESLDTTIRQAQAVEQLKEVYGGVTTQTAMTLLNLQNQLNVATQVTAAGQMDAQALATQNNLLAQGVSLDEASLVAAAQLATAHAQATTQIEKQIESMKDQDAMTKAIQNGTEASTASAIAYKNAINAGADATTAASLATETAHQYTVKAADAALQWQQNLLGVGAAAQQTAAALDAAAQQEYNALTAAHDAQFEDFTSGGDNAFGEFQYKSGIEGNTVSTLPINVQLDNMSPADRDNYYWMATYGIPDPFKNTKTTTSTDKLTSSLDKLSTSTDSLNKTMGEALSPYYTQDPRTSHIGFRSQGMADGGYVDVPGSPSANDNMIATIPVASGERIYVDPMPSKRGGGGGGSQNIVINLGGITVNGGAAKDANAIGRTVYQALQSSSKQISAVSRG